MFFSTKNTLIFSSLLFSASAVIISMEERTGTKAIVERLQNDDSMPIALYRKLYTDKLDPKCAFNASIAQDEYDSVNWMVKKWPVPEGTNILNYFSIIPSDTYDEYVTPIGISQYILQKKTDNPTNSYRGIDGENVQAAKTLFTTHRSIPYFLTPFAQATHTVTSLGTSLNENPIKFLYTEVALRGLNHVVNVSHRVGQRLFIIDGPEEYGRGVFYVNGKHDDLYIAACSKQLALHASEIRELKLAETLSNEGQTVKRLSVLQCLLLIITMNNDTDGLHLIKNLICDNNDFELNRLLGITFYNATGCSGGEKAAFNNKTSFSDDEQIRELIQYPILQSRISFLRGMLDLYLQQGLIKNLPTNGAQIAKAKEILDDVLLDSTLEDIANIDLK